MKTSRIVGFGLVAFAAVLILVSIHLWSDRERKRQGLEVLKGMTPERLVANCGRPTSDSENFIVQGMPLARSIEYRGAKSPYWVKLDFVLDSDGQWRLNYFASAAIGVSPSDNNAYVAVTVFPCMATRDPYLSQ
jgi:hypothetical protein